MSRVCLGWKGGLLPSWLLSQLPLCANLQWTKVPNCQTVFCHAKFCWAIYCLIRIKRDKEKQGRTMPSKENIGLQARVPVFLLGLSSEQGGLWYSSDECQEWTTGAVSPVLRWRHAIDTYATEGRETQCVFPLCKACEFWAILQTVKAAGLSCKDMNWPKDHWDLRIDFPW